MNHSPKNNRLQERESLILRLVWMLVFFFAWQLAELLLLLVVLAQVALRLLNGQVNTDLQAFGDSLSQYIAQIGRFGCFSTEQKPWPLSDWPRPRGPVLEYTDTQSKRP